MKLTNTQLKRIIKEELSKILNESQDYAMKIESLLESNIEQAVNIIEALNGEYEEVNEVVRNKIKQLEDEKYDIETRHDPERTKITLDVRRMMGEDYWDKFITGPAAKLGGIIERLKLTLPENL